MIATGLTVGLLALGGCGSPVSLDESDPPEASSTSTGASSSTTAPTPDESGDDLDDDGVDDDEDDGGAKLDISGGPDLPPEPLPPGMCPPDCQFELSLEWEYDGPSLGEGPAEPDDTLMAATLFNGPVVVAQQRHGAIELAAIEPLFGQELWTLPLPLPCDPCQLVELRSLFSTYMLVSGYGTDGGGEPIAFAARVDPSGRLGFINTTPLVDVPGVEPRAGGLVYMNNLLAQPVIQGSVADGLERLELWVYDAGTGDLVFSNLLDTYLGTAGTAPLFAVEGSDDVVAIGHPSWLGPQLIGSVTWAHAFGGEIESVTARPSTIVGLGTDGVRTVSLGRTIEPGVVLLELHSGVPSEPTQWADTIVHRTDSAPAPVLRVGDTGQIYVAMRTASGPPGRETTTSIQLSRWTSDGEPWWRVALPIQTDYTERPIALTLAEEDSLVIGGFSDGTRHLEQRTPDCICD